MALKNALDGLATEPKQDTTNTRLSDILLELGAKLEAGQEVALDPVTLAALETISVANFPASQAVTGPLTDAQLRASAVPVSVAGQETGLAKEVTLGALLTELGQKLEEGGTVGLNVATLTALEVISVANFPASQPVTGPLTDAQLRAAAVPVSGPITDAQLRASALAVSGPLTDAQLRAAAVPVAGPLTDAQLRADPVLSAITNFPPSQEVVDFAVLDLLQEFRNRYDVVKTAKAEYTTDGPHTLVAPTVGSALRVVWIFAQARGSLADGVVTVTVSLGGNSYQFELTGSQPFAHSAVWEGATDQDLIVTTSSAAPVLVNIDYREFVNA